MHKLKSLPALTEYLLSCTYWVVLCIYMLQVVYLHVAGNNN